MLLVMLLTSVNSWAQETNGTCGEDVTWTYNVETHTLTIGGTGAMYDYPVGNQPWYDFRSAIENVVIESGVTSIGIDAFDNCARIKNVYVLRYDDSDQDNPLTELGQSVFDDNSAFSKIYVPDAEAYKNAENWTHYEDLIQDFDGTCDDPDVNDGKDLYWVYAHHTLTIVGSGAMAEYSEGSAPWEGNRANITKVVIGDGVTHIGDYAFSELIRLNTVTIPANVTSIGEGAFLGCSNLTTVFAWPTTAPTLVDNAFYGCHNSLVVFVKDLTAYTDWNPYIIQELTFCGRDDNDDVYCAYNNGTLTICGTGAMADYYYSTYDQPWCQYQDEITKVVIGDGVTHIGDYAFSDLIRLNSATIPNLVTSIGNNAFMGCTYLTAVTIGSSVTEIYDGAFRKCPSLQSVVMMPEEAPSLAPDAFMPNDYNNDFLAPTYLKIYVPNSSYKDEWSELAGQMVEYDWISGDCAVVEDQTCDGEQYKYSLTIAGGGAMEDYDDDCDRPWYIDITDLVIGEGVTSIGDKAFFGNRGLSTVTIPRSVATIGDNAFMYCTELTSVTILGETEHIGENAFTNCSSLATVTCYAVTPPTLGEGGVFPDNENSCKLYVLNDNTYKKNDYWKWEFEKADINNITVTYIDENGNEALCTEFTVLNSSDFSNLSGGSLDDLTYNLDDEWYIVNSDVNFFYPIQLNAAHIILCDGCTMNVGTNFAPIFSNNCIYGHDLTITAQSSDAATAGSLNLVNEEGAGALSLENYEQYSGNVSISAGNGTGIYAAMGNITVNGGTLDVNTNSDNEYALNADGTDGTITLGWTHAETDFIKANSYYGIVQTADGKALKYTDDDDKIVKLIGDIADLDDIADRKLTAYGYGAYCGDVDQNYGKNLRWDIPLVDDDNDDETPLQPGHVMNITKNPDVNEGEDFTMADYTGSDTPWKDYDDYLSLIFVDTEADYAAYVTNLNDDDQAKLAPTTITIAKNESGWSTFCHNYPVAYSLSDNASAHSISGLSDNNTNVSISDDLGIAEPAIPLLLRYSNEGENVILTAQPETAPAAVSSTAIVSSDFEGGSFYGNCSNTFVSPADLDDYYDEGQTYLLYNGKFIQADENGGLDAHKCLLVLSGTNNAPVLTISSEVTGVTSMADVRSKMADVWFTLDGRKLDKQPTAKGVYIYNSKKVVIK